jgi:hypothetical protein
MITTMKTLSALTIAAAISTVTATLSTPAMAVDQQQALKMCHARGSECRVARQADGSVDIEVDNSDGTRGIQCPKAGPCNVNLITGPKSGKGGAASGGLRTTVEGTTLMPVNPPPKSIAVPIRPIRIARTSHK